MLLLFLKCVPGKYVGKPLEYNREMLEVYILCTVLRTTIFIRRELYLVTKIASWILAFFVSYRFPCKRTLYCLRFSDITKWPLSVFFFQLLDPPDHVGYHTLTEMMHILKGTILPSKIFIPRLNCHQTETFPFKSISSEAFSFWATILPLDSTLNCLFSSPTVLQTSFPQMEGMLFLKSDGNKINPAIIFCKGFLTKLEAFRVIWKVIFKLISVYICGWIKMVVLFGKA